MRTLTVVVTFVVLASCLLMLHTAHFFNKAKKDDGVQHDHRPDEPIVMAQAPKQVSEKKQDVKPTPAAQCNGRKRYKKRGKKVITAQQKIEKEALQPYFNNNVAQRPMIAQDSSTALVNTGEKRTVTLKNVISEEMKAYKYWGTHNPTLFKVTINDQEIKPNEEYTASVTDKVVIRYDWEFMNGARKGGDAVEVAVPAQGDFFAINFSWLKNPRITLETV